MKCKPGTHKVGGRCVRRAEPLQGLRLKDVLESDRKFYKKSGRREKSAGPKVYVMDFDGVEHPVTLEDMKSFFIQARGFPTILCLGEVCGEGQSGGREVTEMVKQAENEFVKKYGLDGYRSRMDTLMRAG